MEEAKTKHSFDLKTVRAHFDKIKDNAKEEALIRLDQELTKIYHATRDAVLYFIEQKVEEAAATVIKNLLELKALTEDIDGKISDKAEEFAQDHELKEKCLEKLNLARTKIEGMMALEGRQYDSEKVSFKFSINSKKIIPKMTKQMGIELYLDQEWIIKKPQGGSLAEGLAAQGAINNLKS